MEYKKIMTAGHEIPSKNVIADFFSTVDAFLAKDDARIIGKIRVHPWPLLWIRIRKYLDLPDPDPWLFVLIRIRVLPSPSKLSKKNLDFFCDFFMTFYLRRLETDVNLPSKSKKQNNLFLFDILKATDEKSKIRSWIR